MSPSDWIAIVAIAVSIVLFFVGVIRAHGKDDRAFQEKNSTDHARYSEKIERLQEEYRSLRKFNDDHLIALLDGIKSDAYGTMSNQKQEIDRRLDRIERTLNGKLK